MGTTDPTKAAAGLDPGRPRPRLGRRRPGEPRPRLRLAGVAAREIAIWFPASEQASRREPGRPAGLVWGRSPSPLRKAPSCPSSRSSPGSKPLLPQVSKPIQYVGGELNSQVKDWDVAGARRSAGR